MGRTYSAKRRSSPYLGPKPFESAFTVEDSNPASVLPRTTGRILFYFLKKCPKFLEYQSITSISPNLYSLELRGSRTSVRPVLPVRNNH
jgi:hypothetical protein